MGTKLVAGVDCSTQSTKVLVVDVENGEIKGSDSEYKKDKGISNSDSETERLYFIEKHSTRTNSLKSCS